MVLLYSAMAKKERIMKRSQAEETACILTGIWMALKLLTFIITPLLNMMRWPLRLILLAALCFWLYFIFLDYTYQMSKRGSRRK